MRIALLYPPPWKIPAPGAPADRNGDGPPRDYREGDLDADFHQTPYGLYSLGAQAIAVGHQVKLFNLSAFAWSRVEEVIEALDAELFGMSCWTANRRGVALVARLIREQHPGAHIVIGGPHATPLAREMLEHYPALDTVVTGEGEITFLELVDRLQRGRPMTGLAGAFFREGDRVVEGPARAPIRDLDALVSPHEHYRTHIVMTSRGCPWRCTFCGADTTWGRGFRSRSVARVLDDLELALGKLPVRMLQIKDDTFTTNEQRVIEICRGIRERGLRFLWSCDTRVDVLSEELLYEMRLAGCQRLSLGVESGSPKVLALINKKITPDKIIESTGMAKKAGIQVRYYMMLGNRGETAGTFRETLAFLQRAKPHQYLFSCLSIYPGTADFHDARKAGRLDREVYFTGDFQELKTPFDASGADARVMDRWFSDHSGLHDFYREGVAGCRAILERLGDYHAAHMDLAGACYRDGRFGAVETHARRALDLGYPLPGLALDYLACVAFEHGDVKGMQRFFMQAAKTDPQHAVLIQNVQAARRWFADRGPERGLPLRLVPHHDFQLLERTEQPSLPGPLPADFAEWPPAPVQSRFDGAGSQAALRDRTRAKVVSSP